MQMQLEICTEACLCGQQNFHTYSRIPTVHTPGIALSLQMAEAAVRTPASKARVVRFFPPSRKEQQQQAASQIAQLEWVFFIFFASFERGRKISYGYVEARLRVDLGCLLNRHGDEGLRTVSRIRHPASRSINRCLSESDRYLP